LRPRAPSFSETLPKTRGTPAAAAVRPRAAPLPMARRLLHLRSRLQALAPRLVPSRQYMSDMRRSVFLDRLLRSLRSEISSCRAEPAPRPPPSAAPFALDDRPGEQWVRLRRAFGEQQEEEVRVDASMVDGAVAPTRSGVAAEDGGPQDRMHISVHVEVSKPARPDFALKFECSAWPEEMDVERVFPVRRSGPTPEQQYMGRQFRELDEEMQTAVRDYLEQRGVNDELAAFLHTYMENKEQTELVGWLKNIECYLKK
uniref:Mitochondrial glycoprotein n=6 Tax=Aegilops tauschii subsp. strangulata TaxID=200361 RepID=A0A453D806_AEGTS